MYERMLVPLDGSKTAEAILPSVEDLVSKLGSDTEAEVTLLEVISDMTYNVLTRDRRAQLPLSENELEQIKKQAQDYLERVAETLRAKGIKVNTMVAVGETTKEIIKAAHEIDANVITMSTHGFSGIKRWALGSVADEVVKLSDIPVMVIRAK